MFFKILLSVVILKIYIGKLKALWVDFQAVRTQEQFKVQNLQKSLAYEDKV